MNKNPYSQLVKIMQEQGRKYNSPSTKIGTVINVNLPNITIKIDELTIEKDNIYIDEKLTIPDALKQGDLVAITPLICRQTYLITNKVVKL